MGGWVPIDKALVRELPHDRPFTRLEAMLSLAIDYDNVNLVSVRGYSKLWQWTERRVRGFLKEVGAEILYPENTANRQNQRGVIATVITERTRSDSGVIKLIDSKWLAMDAERKRSDSGVKAERSRPTTIEPNPRTLKKPLANPPADVELPPWLPLNEWNNFLQMRREIKKPLTAAGTRQALAKLDALRQQGHPPAEVLGQSTINGWQGLFELKSGLRPADNTAQKRKLELAI